MAIYWFVFLESRMKDMHNVYDEMNITFTSADDGFEFDLIYVWNVYVRFQPKQVHLWLNYM